MATGVMTVALGGATRFIELIPSHEKSYTAVIKFGIATDTLDITGNVLEESDKKVSREEFEGVLYRHLQPGQHSCRLVLQRWRSGLQAAFAGCQRHPRRGEERKR